MPVPGMERRAGEDPRVVDRANFQFEFALLEKKELAPPSISVSSYVLEPVRYVGTPQ